jgi:hypothetical protein
VRSTDVLLLWVHLDLKGLEHNNGVSDKGHSRPTTKRGVVGAWWLTDCPVVSASIIM